MTDTREFDYTVFGDKVYKEMTGRFGEKVTPLYSKGNGMNREYYSLGNIGWWLSMQREQAGKTRTCVADEMHWPHGAIKDIEEGKRIPKAETVFKYLRVLRGETLHAPLASDNMYLRFHRSFEFSAEGVKRWLRSLPSDTIVYGTDVPSRSCILTTYLKTYDKRVEAVGLERVSGYDDVTLYHIPGELQQYIHVFDDLFAYESGCTAEKALQIIEEKGL